MDYRYAVREEIRHIVYRCHDNAIIREEQIASFKSKKEAAKFQGKCQRNEVE